MDYKVRVVEKTLLSDMIFHVVVDLIEPKQMQFKAGQAIAMHVDPKNKRLYSITNSPKLKDKLVFCMDVSPMGLGSRMILNFKAGDDFILDGPHGVFVVKDNSRDLLFVCTGAGIAPFKSIISDLLENDFDRKITLLFGVRSEADIIYYDFFKELAGKHRNFEFIQTLSQPKGEWQGEQGRVTTILQKNPEKFRNRLAYICGSLEMIKDTRKVLLDLGFPMRDIKIENYG